MNGDRESTEVIFRLRRDKIRQAMVELPRRFLHLLAQEKERRQFLGACFISVEDDIISNGMGRPQSMNAARDQETFSNDSIEKCLCIVEQFSRLFAELGIVKNSGISAAQFPRMKKRRPVN